MSSLFPYFPSQLNANGTYENLIIGHRGIVVDTYHRLHFNFILITSIISLFVWYTMQNSQAPVESTVIRLHRFAEHTL